MNAVKDNQTLLNRLNSLIFYLLLATIIGLLGWLSLRFSTTWDWTEDGRNSLHPASIKLLQQLDAPLSITSYAPDTPALRDGISEIIDRYRRNSDKITFRFINPATEPELTRQSGIQVSGELVLEYQGRSEKLRDLNEESISNTIQRLVLQGDFWLASLIGHGERRFDKPANHDLSEFGNELKVKGFKVQTLDLAQGLQVPNNIRLLILASPQTALLEGETNLLLDYIERGGNLLWLIDPTVNQATDQTQVSLNTVANQLDITFLPGTIVDANAASLGLDNPAYAIVSQYPDHLLTAGFDLLTLYPYAAALQATENTEWVQTPILSTQDRAWNETGEIRGEIQPNSDQNEVLGPLAIGIALERQQAGHDQRIIVIGDGDFLSNAFLGNAGNLDLGINIVRWLANDDQLLNIPARTAQDTRLALSTMASALIGIGFLIVLPTLFIAAGIFIWLRRRRR